MPSCVLWVLLDFSLRTKSLELSSGGPINNPIGMIPHFPAPLDPAEAEGGNGEDYGKKRIEDQYSQVVGGNSEP